MARFHFDQNVARDIAEGLREHGHDVMTTNEAGLLDADDDIHLLAAADADRILVTHNGRDFRLLHHAWVRWARAWGVSRAHAGILIIPQPPYWKFRMAVGAIVVFMNNIDDEVGGAPLANELYEYLRDDQEWQREPPS